MHNRNSQIPPTDIDAEQRLLGAILHGAPIPAGLRGEHFAEPPRQAPAECSYRRMCDERQRFVASLWAWLASNPAPGDAALELAATQSQVRQLAEIAGNASAAQ